MFFARHTRRAVCIPTGQARVFWAVGKKLAGNTNDPYQEGGYPYGAALVYPLPGGEGGDGAGQDGRLTGGAG